MAKAERASVPGSTAAMASADKANPVSYRVKQDGAGYLVFALPSRPPVPAGNTKAARDCRTLG